MRGSAALTNRTTIEIKVLGELEVRVGPADRTPKGALPRAIFCILVGRLGKAISTDALIEAAWNGSPPKSARSSLRVHISRIRQVIDLPELLVTTDHGYRLQSDPQTIDAYRFEFGVNEGRRLLEAGASGRAVAILQSALAEWRGEPYVDAPDNPQLQSEAARLIAMKYEAEVDLVAAEMEAAGSTPDISSIEASVLADPLDERRWALLMKGLYRSGRQAEALDAYKRASRLLGEELGLEPGPVLQAMEDRILIQDPKLLPNAGSPVITLPGFATSLVGRSEEAALVSKRLGEHRLITLTGLGGAGKTRLAVAAAQDAVSQFPDGAVFVPLDSVSEAGLVTDAIVSKIGKGPTADPTAALVETIADRRMALVLDSCEHLIDEVANVVSRLLSQCPNVGILCTSRIPIGVIGETLFPIAPLEVPELGEGYDNPAELLQYESVALFCERAREARPGFVIDASNGSVIAELVRRLAGIPLSIEIAAAKSDLLNPADILDRIEAGTGALVAGQRDRADRHRSMSEAVAWSLDLLDEPAQELFERMAVFQSPVDSDTIEAVCSDASLDPGAVHGSLAALARSALVSVDLDGVRARYSQLPPIRAVAHEMLGAEEARFRRRHNDHYAALAAGEVGNVGGSDEAASFERLTSGLDELRSALRYAAGHHSPIGSQMCIDLGTYWIRTGRTKEGRDWVAGFLKSNQSDPEVRGALLHLAGSLALVEQDLEAADDALSAALELRRENDQPRELGMTLSNLGGLANSRGDYDKAEALFAEALHVFEAEGYDRGAAAASLNLGLASLNLGRMETAVGKLQRAVDGFRRIGDRGEEAHALTRLGFAHAALGDVARAEACSLAAHHIYVSLGRPPDVAYSHWTLSHHYLETEKLDLSKKHAAAAAEIAIKENLERWWIPGLVELAAAIAGAAGDPEQGARLLGCGEAHRRAHDVPVPDANKEFREQTFRTIEKALGRESFVVEVEIGGTRSLREGLAAVAGWS